MIPKSFQEKHKLSVSFKNDARAFDPAASVDQLVQQVNQEGPAIAREGILTATDFVAQTGAVLNIREYSKE